MSSTLVLLEKRSLGDFGRLASTQNFAVSGSKNLGRLASPQNFAVSGSKLGPVDELPADDKDGDDSEDTDNATSGKKRERQMANKLRYEDAAPRTPEDAAKKAADDVVTRKE